MPRIGRRDAVAEAYGVSWPYVLAILGIETAMENSSALARAGCPDHPRFGLPAATGVFCSPRRVFLQQMHAEGLIPWIATALRRRPRAVHSQQLPGFRRILTAMTPRSMGRGRRPGKRRELSAVHRWTPKLSGTRPSVCSRGGQGPARNGLDPSTTVGAPAAGAEGQRGPGVYLVALLEMEGEGGEWIADAESYVITRYNRPISTPSR